MSPFCFCNRPAKCEQTIRSGHSFAGRTARALGPKVRISRLSLALSKTCSGKHHLGEGTLLHVSWEIIFLLQFVRARALRRFVLIARTVKSSGASLLSPRSWKESMVPTAMPLLHPYAMEKEFTFTSARLVLLRMILGAVRYGGSLFLFLITNTARRPRRYWRVIWLLLTAINRKMRIYLP